MKLAYTLPEAADVANVCRSDLRKSITTGQGPTIRKAGRRGIILREDLVEWLRSLPKASRREERHG